MQTITRKFLVKQIPSLNTLEKVEENRFYLYRKNGSVIRIQSKGNRFELEKKIDTSDLVRESEKIALKEEEFESLKKTSTDKINRDTYLILGTPPIALRLYHGRFEGLVRAEVNFQSVNDAEKYTAPDWLGREITDSPLSKDETLLSLSEEEFNKLLM